MKETSILKSFTELSPELIAANAPAEEPTKKLQAPQPVEEIPPAPQHHSSPASPETRGYQCWGINE
jgi:hypothetical protein